MAKKVNTGKMFEEDFKNSIPSNVWYYRFKDGTGAWSGGTTRFQSKNICDCMIFYNKLQLLELKSTKQKSLAFSNIKQNQIDELLEASKYNIDAGFLIKITERVFYITIQQFNSFLGTTIRKSLPLNWIIKNGIEIPATKKVTRFRYDISRLL